MSINEQDIIQIDTADRDYVAAKEEGILKETRDRYLSAADMRREIAEIDFQLKQNGFYIKTETDENTRKKMDQIYEPDEARKLRQKLTIEAEKQEGYPWSERSHTGLFAFIAGIIRAVKYIIFPTYRNQLTQIQQAEIHTGLLKAAEKLSNQEEKNDPKHELGKNDKTLEVPPADKKEMREENTQEKTSKDFSEKEKEILESIKNDLVSLEHMPEDQISPAVAKAALHYLKMTEYDHAKESGKGDDWWQKEGWYQGLKSVIKYPVLAKGLSEKELASYAPMVLLRSPKSAVYFPDNVLKNAVPAFLDKAQHDKKHSYEKHIAWIKRDATTVPALKSVLEIINKEHQKNEENPATEIETDQIQEIQTEHSSFYDQFGTEFNVSGDPMSVMESPEEYFSHTSMIGETWNEQEIVNDKEDNQPTWYTMDEFQDALDAFYKENEYAQFTMSREDLKLEIIARNPELIRYMPNEDLTFPTAVTAVINNISVMKYIPENYEFDRESGFPSTMEDLKNVVREEVPKLARDWANAEHIPIEEVMKQICRDPKESGHRMQGDRRDVAKLKEKIMEDFQKSTSEIYVSKEKEENSYEI